MLAGSVVAFSLTSGAENGVDLPAEAEGKVYKGTPSTSLKGAGTEADPYLIQSADDFVYFLQDRCLETATDSVAKTKGLYYKLMCDIYLNAQNSTAYSLPAMNDTNGYRNFGGELDGDGHTIYNPYASGAGHWALFYQITGTVKDLSIAGTYFNNTGTSSANASAAVLAYRLNGATVQNVHVSDAYLIGGTSGPIMGGIASNMSGGSKVIGCTVSGTIAQNGSGTISAGGLVGSMDKGNGNTVQDCVNYATITGIGKNSAIGGILGGVKATNKVTGANDSTSILRCENRGAISIATEKDDGTAIVSDGSCIGGIVGMTTFPNLTIQDCRNDADVNGYLQAGGVIGAMHILNQTTKTVIDSCENRGNVSSKTLMAGGLIGRVQDTRKGSITIYNSANYGSVTAANYAGGMIGAVQPSNGSFYQTPIEFINSATYGDVSATVSHAGLAFGMFVTWNSAEKHPVNILNCVLKGKVTAPKSAGSIYGAIEAGSSTNKGVVTKYLTHSLNITNTYVKCDVTVANADNAASLFGYPLSLDETGYYITSLTLNDLTKSGSQFDVTVTAGGVKQEAPYSYILVVTDEETSTTSNVGKTVTLPAMSPTALTDGSAVKALSTYASTNGYTLWTQGTSYPEFAQMKLDGATLNLGAEMTMKFLLKADSLAGLTDYLKDLYVTVDGTTRYAGVLNSQTGNYEFEVNDLAARDFAKEAVYKLQYTTKKNTETIVTCTDGISYSPVTYATRMYNANKDDSTKTDFTNLLVALVQYTAAAAGDPTIAANFATATGYVFPEAGYGDYAAIKAKDGASTFTYAENASGIAEMGASLTGSLNLILTPKKASYTAVTAKIGEAELEVVKSGGTWVIKGLYASELYDTITFTFTGDGVDTVTATYSVARFLSNYVGTDYAALAQATAIYMDAANTYARGN